MRAELDRVSLTAGLTLIAVGTLLLLDQSGSIELTVGLVFAIAAAAIGTILIASGLGDGKGDGDD